MALPNTLSTSGSDPHLTGVYSQEWESKLQERLDYPLNWKDVCDVRYSSTYAVNWPYMATSFSTASGTRGSAYAFSAFSLTNDQLIIDQFVVVPIAIDRADLSQCSLANQTEFADRQGSLLNEKIESAVLAGHVSWTDFGTLSIGGGGAVTSTITVSINNIDNIIRAMKREIAENNAQNLADKNGLFIVWRAADLELLEEFAQANGFNLADTALKNGIKSGYHFMGVDHYVSNSHAAGHVFAGVKKIMQVGILSSTYGKVVTVQEPASGVGTYGPLSGVGIIARIDYGINTPTGLSTCVFDVNVA